MAKALWNRGKPALQLSFKVSANATVYMNSASQNGVGPFRVAKIDEAFAPSAKVGDNMSAPVMHPTSADPASSASARGENIIGVIFGPENTLVDSSLGTEVYQPIARGKGVDVVPLGIVPILSDGQGTVVTGALVGHSVTSNYGGCVVAATKVSSHNYPSVDKHLVGVNVGPTVAATAGLAVLTLLRIQEA